MNFDIIRLNNNIVKSIPVDLTYSFTREELDGTDLISLDDVKVTGEIFKNSLGNIELYLNVVGVMVLPCAITLKPVSYPFDIEISGEYDEIMQEMGEISTNFKNTIDIFPIIWENILMEIPMRVVSDDVSESDLNKSGEGWSFTSKDDNKHSPLSELMEMIDDSEVR